MQGFIWMETKYFQHEAYNMYYYLYSSFVPNRIQMFTSCIVLITWYLQDIYERMTDTTYIVQKVGRAQGVRTISFSGNFPQFLGTVPV